LQRGREFKRLRGVSNAGFVQTAGQRGDIACFGMEQLLVLGRKVLEESRRNSCHDGPLMLDLILESRWEGGSVREYEKNIPVDVL